MAHPGLTFALAVGVALGALLYYLFPGNSNAEQPYQYDAPDVPVHSTWVKSKKRKIKYDSGEDCSICLSIMYSSSKELTELTCGHTFHSFCITQWFKESRVCPNCRRVA